MELVRVRRRAAVPLDRGLLFWYVLAFFKSARNAAQPQLLARLRLPVLPGRGKIITAALCQRLVERSDITVTVFRSVPVALQLELHFPVSKTRSRLLKHRVPVEVCSFTHQLEQPQVPMELYLVAAELLLFVPGHNPFAFRAVCATHRSSCRRCRCRCPTACWVRQYYRTTCE